MTVLIVAHLFEPSVNAAISCLERNGVQWARINCEEFPLFLQSDVRIDQDNAFAVLDTARGPIDTRDIESVWFRRIAKPAVLKSLSVKDKDFIRSECNAFLNGAFDLIVGKWINKRESERAATKIRQLAVASRLGFNVPKTLLTNSPAAVRDFADRVSGRVIFKPVSGYAPRGADFSRQLEAYHSAHDTIEIEDAVDNSGIAEIVFTQLLTPEKITEIGAIQICPAIFQECIEKKADIRVTVVGKSVFSCRIRSQDTADTKIDFRRMVLRDSIKGVIHEKNDLPDNVLEKIFNLMKELDLVFGCIDFAETNEGKYVFLEINPSGQWMWIEQIVGYPISSTLANELGNKTLLI